MFSIPGIALTQTTVLVHLLWHMRKRMGPSIPYFLEKDQASRYTSYMMHISKTYKYFASALVVIDNSELVIEMLARRLKGGRKGQIRVVTIAEAAKSVLVEFVLGGGDFFLRVVSRLHGLSCIYGFCSACLRVHIANITSPIYPVIFPDWRFRRFSSRFVARVGMLVSSGYRTILSRPIPTAGPAKEAGHWRGEHTDRIYPMTLASPEDIIGARLSDLGNMDPRCLVDVKEGAGLCAEVLYHARFLVYLFLRMKCKRESWTPWVTVMLLEITTCQLSMRDKEHSGIVHTEYIARMHRLLEYIWRKPFFDKMSSPVIDFMARATERLPILYPLAGKSTASVAVFRMQC